MKHLRSIIILLFALALTGHRAQPCMAAGRFVTFTPEDRAVPLFTKADKAMTILCDDADHKGIKIALNSLCEDFRRVGGFAPRLIGGHGAAATAGCDPKDIRIVVGSLDKSNIVSRLIKAGKTDGALLKGKREKFVITTLHNPAKDIPGDVMLIAGSDKRGTIYGIYELSRQMGVSPWYWWMDVPAARHDAVYIRQGIYSDGEPRVRYRGIFLNDEAPCLTSWVKNTFGTGYGDHRFYAKVFELILRLKGNFMWPAMWGWAFYADDALNSKTADDMGVVIGTSHHEPMARSHKEWHGHSDDPGAEPQDQASRQAAGGKWDYATNKDNLDRFWRGGVERNKNTEDIITIGMRGDGDMAMSEDMNLSLLKSVISNQRRIISQVRHKPAKEVPQVWALYKEVMDYYDNGLRVPDDVTIMLCDDNWGNVRRVPATNERRRSGGWGLYYHADYVGAPRNSKLINATPIQHEWEQLSLACEYGIDRLWILNVGDLKPMEYPIQLFMDMAWDPESAEFATDSTGLLRHTLDFCNSLFGEAEGPEAARLLNLCCKLNGRSTAEMLDSKTYSLQTGEWSRVTGEYDRMEIDALRQYANLPAEYRDAYFELILFPVQLMANLHRMYYAQAMNNDLAKRGDAAMNDWADRCEEYFHRDSLLMAQYNHKVANGKWNGMMMQKHIGYTSWNDNFAHDTMPEVQRTKSKASNTFADDGRGYISIEAPHYSARTDAARASWTELPLMGRTLGAMTLMPRTEPVGGASLTYRFYGARAGNEEEKTRKVRVHVVTKTTLDFLNKGGMTYSVAVDGGKPVTVNFNGNLNESKKNIYTVYYPTVARRVIEKVVDLELGETADGIHSLTFTPNDPDIILEKIVIDFGGYTPQYLFGGESIRR